MYISMPSKRLLINPGITKETHIKWLDRSLCLQTPNFKCDRKSQTVDRDQITLESSENYQERRKGQRMRQSRIHN